MRYLLLAVALLCSSCETAGYILQGIGSGMQTANRPSSASCPVDGASVWFTGRTTVVSGVLMHEYQCPYGHTSWGR